MCDRIAVIHGGGVSAVNTPDELKQGLAPDIVTLHSTNPEEVTERLSDLASEGYIESDSVHLECDEGAQMIAAAANRVPRDLITVPAPPTGTWRCVHETYRGLPDTRQ